MQNKKYIEDEKFQRFIEKFRAWCENNPAINTVMPTCRQARKSNNER
jgi:hypothetical protein